MKKLFLFSIFMIFALLGLQAQNFKAGLLAGAVPSQVDGDNMRGFNKIGWTAGAYLSLEQGKNLVWQLDIAYTTKGSRQKSSKDYDYSRSNISASYIDFVLSCGYKIADNIVLKAGLTPSVLISHKEENSYGYEPSETIGFTPLNLLGMAGASYSIGEHWAVNASYNYSLLSFRSGKLYFINFDFKRANAQFHNYITLSVSYQF